MSKRFFNAAALRSVSLLSHAHARARPFCRLRYPFGTTEQYPNLDVDEAHAYHGVFGSHVALVLRRRAPARHRAQEARRAIEADLFGGKLRGVVATSALELGVDVGCRAAGAKTPPALP